MTELQSIRFDLDSRGIATVTLNRPEVHNAFNLTVVRELQQAFDAIHENPKTRVAVLRGAGKSFSAGGESEWMREQALADMEKNREGAREMAHLFRSIDECRVPVIGAIHGAALGGGTRLPCAVDIAVATPTAFFGFTEVRLGIVPAVISPYAIRRLGYSQAKQHFLLGGRIQALEAHRIGLIHYLAEDLQAKVDELVEQLLAGSPAAQSRIKPLARTVYDSSDAVDFTIEQITQARAHREGQDGLSAFLEKRPPLWIETH